jgi:putative oxidoreductase
MSGVDVAILVLRLAVGGTMIAHGCNHAFGGGRLAGTAGWFESIGIRPGRLHAVLATLVELGAGAMLVVGLLTPLAAAGVVGTMGVALVANHMHNGFFVFRPGEGYEYVLNLIVAAIALGGLGAARRRSITCSPSTSMRGSDSRWLGVRVVSARRCYWRSSGDRHHESKLPRRTPGTHWNQRVDVYARVARVPQASENRLSHLVRRGNV